MIKNFNLYNSKIMELKSLKSFELVNNKTIHLISGGTAKDSKKGDVTSTSKDSKKDDGSPSFV